MFAELLLGQPIFPGDSGVDQLVEIIKVLGTPTKEQIRQMNSNYTEFKFPQIKAHPWNKVGAESVCEGDRGGNSLPFGILAPGSLSSLKKACAHASMGEIREEGVYSNSRLTRSNASGGVRGLNTCMVYVQ